MIDAGAWQPVEGAVPVAGAGPHRVRLRALDRAGNVSAERPVSFTLAPAPANQRLVWRGDALECDPGSPWSSGTVFTTAGRATARSATALPAAGSCLAPRTLGAASPAARCRERGGRERGGRPAGDVWPPTAAPALSLRASAPAAVRH